MSQPRRALIHYLRVLFTRRHVQNTHACTRREVALSPCNQRGPDNIKRRMQAAAVELVSARPALQGREFTSRGDNTDPVGPIHRPLHRTRMCSKFA
jgi:hypothetical protein